MTADRHRSRPLRRRLHVLSARACERRPAEPVDCVSEHRRRNCDLRRERARSGVAADELTDIAEAYGLIEAYGVDEVQRIIASAFASTRAARPRAAARRLEDPAWVRDEQPKGNGHGNSENEPPPLPYVDLALDLVPRAMARPRSHPDAQRHLHCPAKAHRQIVAPDAIQRRGRAWQDLDRHAARERGRCSICPARKTTTKCAAGWRTSRAISARRAQKMIEHGLRFLSFAGKDAILGATRPQWHHSTDTAVRAHCAATRCSCARSSSCSTPSPTCSAARKSTGRRPGNSSRCSAASRSMSTPPSSCLRIRA